MQDAAFLTYKQRLFYETVNLSSSRILHVAEMMDVIISDDEPTVAAPLICMDAQRANLLPDLWCAVQIAGGDLRGRCPITT